MEINKEFLDSLFEQAKENPRLRQNLDFLTSSLCHPKILVKEFCYFLMPCHKHGLCIDILI